MVATTPSERSGGRPLQAASPRIGAYLAGRRENTQPFTGVADDSGADLSQGGSIWIERMAYLLDTHVLSELRKGTRCNARVGSWFAEATDESLFTSVLVMGELQRGVDRIRRRDARSAVALEHWLSNLTASYADRILPISLPVRACGAASVPPIRYLPWTGCSRRQLATMSSLS